MRVSKNAKEAVCTSCGEDFAHSLEMYDLMIGDVLVTVCDKCNEEILKKCCSASCKYNGKLKSQEDIRKINVVQKYRVRGGRKHDRN